MLGGCCLKKENMKKVVKKHYELSPNNVSQFKEVLIDLKEILSKHNLASQEIIIDNSLLSLEEENYNTFIELLNSNEYWGAAGAIWEIYIEDSKDKAFFNNSIIKLIDLMNKLELNTRNHNFVKKALKKNT